MNQPDNHEDLERLLREAFAAKAAQVDQQDLDLDREDAVAEQLRSSRPGPGRARRLVAGVGILAAAAAAVGVVALAIHPGEQHTTDAVHPAVTVTSTTSSATSTVGVGPSTATTPSSSVTTKESPDGAQAPPPSSGVDRLSTVPSTPSTSSTTTSPSSTTVTSDGSGGTDMTMESATALPPAMPSGLPQSGQLATGQEYDGPVPLAAVDDSGARMLSMADGTKWEVTVQGTGSMTVRLTDLPVDIEAYWAGTLPSQGWQQSGGGWTFPGTPYAVSAITDTGSFTVSW